ncbi:DUF58 domain-containing protein [Aromatoleum evansii]|uniref:DUF58 domain-containing protein n=1 Tax=Aromatoleum evansii TaxID=59406 RepID=UPI00145DDCF7|nr:DUF58 domain-containing protein [Aromatoleum evansii]
MSRITRTAPQPPAQTLAPGGAEASNMPLARDLIALRTRVVDGAWRRTDAKAGLAGAHRTAFTGRGMEFAEVRAYRPGDDLRNVDWRHTARRGRPFTKLFQDEREHPVLVFVDLGPTMQFGSRVAFKSVIAARAAALLAWAAVEAGDRIGGVVWNGRTHREIPPRGRETGALALIRALTSSAAAYATSDRPAPSASREGAMLALARALRPGTHAVLISDFQAPGACSNISRLRAGSGLSLIQVFDPLESTPPPAGVYRVADGDTEQTLDLRGDAARAVYGEPFRRRSAQLAATARHCGATLIQLATNDDPADVLRALIAPLHPRAQWRAP